MECSTPQVEPSMVTNQPNTPDKAGVAFGFVIDNVQNIRNFSATHDVFFQICADPEISVFPNDKIKSFQRKSNEYLTISVGIFMNIYNIEIAYLYFGRRIILSRFQFIRNIVLLGLCILFITTVTADWLMSYRE